ncbi:tetratricopeptide repeat protein [Flavobacterium croceum]|uniref:Tetratricopeptide repeat protein n=1 Tax=Flavobacterium croceum DSM 17960 TaxID=1121886 RepID=A0A2S4NBN2_9FLAO|nr:tetratricopeptide repeat protein [Flavobacterium croceum]POS03102.1 tetratricopeptide repeat protein [Flavobacterium croceum DSM 17960]
MRTIFVLLFFLLSSLCVAQNEQLAQNYFDRGEFEKALVSYEELLKSMPNNYNYFVKTIECLQQLQQFDKAQNLIEDRLKKYNQSSLLIELGYNYQLRKDMATAEKYYNQALDKVKKTPAEVYGVAGAFERRVIINYAINAYETALALEPKFNFNYQLALLYGQKGDTEMMIDKFLTESFNNPQNTPMIQNQLSRFMMEDASMSFYELLKKSLLIRSQKSQDVFWNQYLSWFFVQNKEYSKAFVQEKAIYKRNPESFSNIVNLAQLAIDDKNDESAVEILQFVLTNTTDIDLQIKAHTYLMQMRVDHAQAKDYEAVSLELENLLKQYGVSPGTLPLVILKAHFTAFTLKRPEEAKDSLKKALEFTLNRDQQADAKMELADILLLEEKFNQALLYYSQIEADGGNNPTAQEASLKIAKTSYYQSDFVWANQQLSVLKSASTQLIANDALDLFLLISDNTVEDSTQVALKKFSKADFLVYKDKKIEALEAFKQILKEHKGETIEAVTLLRIGKLYEKLGDATQALAAYKEILDHHKDCIYIDEALYFSGEIYMQVPDIEQAKSMYEQVIMQHEDSIYYVESQKKYRKLRGDKDI